MKYKAVNLHSKEEIFARMPESLFQTLEYLEKIIIAIFFSAKEDLIFLIYGVYGYEI